MSICLSEAGLQLWELITLWMVLGDVLFVLLRPKLNLLLLGGFKQTFNSISQLLFLQ